MKKTKFLESKILTVALGLFIAGNVYGLLDRSLTPTDYRHCGVFQFSGTDGYGHVEFTNHESVYNLTREGEFCANLEFFAKSETGLVPITALNRLHNGDSLTVIPVYDSVYTELLKVKPDASALTPRFTGQPSWITVALREDEKNETTLIIYFEDLDSERVYAAELKGAYFDEQDVFHFEEKELRLADDQEFARQADPSRIRETGKEQAGE